MKTLLFFWREEAEQELPAASIAHELHAGNDVEGLIDLPVQEIIARLKEEFPAAVERAGELAWRQGEASFEATWSWQHVSMQVSNLHEETRDRLIEVLLSFGCRVYDAQLDL